MITEQIYRENSNKQIKIEKNREKIRKEYLLPVLNLPK